MNSRRAVHAAHEPTADMNNITSVLSATQALPDPGAAGGTESSAGTAGTFSQLLAQFSPAPPAAAPLNESANSASADGINTGSPPATPTMSSAERAKTANTDEANEAPAVDPSLVAALLGQMQAPYAMLTPAQPAPAPAGESAGTATSLAIGGTSSDGLTATSNNLSTLTVPSETSLLNSAAGDADLLATSATRTDSPAPGSATKPSADAPSSTLNAAAIAAMTSAEALGAETPAPTAPNALTVTTDKAARPAVIDPMAAATLAQAAAATGAQLSPSLRKDLSTPVADETEMPSISAVDREDQENPGRSPSLAHSFPQPFASPLNTPATPVDISTAGSETDTAVTLPPILTAMAPMETKSQVFDLKQKIDTVNEASATGFALPAAHVKADNAVPQVAIAAYLDSPEWKPAFASSVKVLVDDGISAATLQLNPAEFGPIDVRIVMNDKRADVTFLVSNPDANAALQSALPELREQLARGGIELGQTSVGAHTQNPRQPGDTPRRQSQGSPDALEATSPVRPAGALAPSPTTGRIDTFA